MNFPMEFQPPPPLTEITNPKTNQNSGKFSLFVWWSKHLKVHPKMNFPMQFQNPPPPPPPPPPNRLLIPRQIKIAVSFIFFSDEVNIKYRQHERLNKSLNYATANRDFIQTVSRAKVKMSWSLPVETKTWLRASVNTTDLCGLMAESLEWITSLHQAPSSYNLSWKISTEYFRYNIQVKCIWTTILFYFARI